MFGTHQHRDVTMAPFGGRLLEATAKRPDLHSGRWHPTRLLTAGFVLACVATVAPCEQPKPPAAPSIANTAERPWAIVTLESEPGMPSIIALDSALRRALAEPGSHPVDVFSESLDAIHFPQAQIENKFIELLAKKYSTIHIDAVVAVGTAALDFAEKYRSQLWPNARILFQVVPVEDLDNRQLSPTTTGIPTQWDFAGGVELAIALRPSTRRLVVIYGSADFDRSAAAIARRQLARFSPRLNTEYWTDASIDQFLRRVGQLDANDAVLYITITRDPDGRTFIPRDVLERLAAVSPAPIYAPFETYIGHGVVAGNVYSYEARGRRLAELLHEALSAPTAPIPLVTMTSSCMADANQLKRFGMAESSLPTGCEVRFREPSLWRDHRVEISIGVAVVLIQAGLITMLLVERRSRHRTSAALAESQQQMSLAVSAAGLSPWIWDASDNKNGTPSSRLESKRRRKGKSIRFEEVIDSVHPADRENLRRAVWRALGTGNELDVEYRVVQANDGERWISARGRAEGGASERLLGVALDITEHKAADLRAAEDRSALRHVGRVSVAGQLSAAIAHQLNQPLAAILGNAETAQKMLAREKVDLTELSEICSDIVSENHRATKVIRRLNDLYKRGDMKSEAIDLNELVRETLDLLRSELLIRHVTSVIELVTGLPVVEGGRIQLQQVVLNLVLNAADAMSEIEPEKRKVTLRTGFSNASVRLYVIDHGSGIPTEYLKTVFDPFWTTKTGGMGMGLAICQSIVASHRGSITASNNPEGGATFCVVLPTGHDTSP